MDGFEGKLTSLKCLRLQSAQEMDGFEGKLTSSKWSKIAKCSRDTAIRDINDLIEKNMLQKATAGDRSTSYELKT